MQFKEEPLIQLQRNGRLLAYEGTYFAFGANPDANLVRLEDDRLPGTLRLASSKMEVTESGGSIVIDVDRVGGSTGPLTGTLETIDGSAFNGSNYIGTNFVVSFGDGEFGRKSFTIPILADLNFTGHKTFDVVIKSETGAIVDSGAVLIKDEQLGTVDAALSVRLDSPSPATTPKE